MKKIAFKLKYNIAFEKKKKINFFKWTQFYPIFNSPRWMILVEKIIYRYLFMEFTR